MNLLTIRKILLILLVFSAVLDPAGGLVGSKYPLFVAFIVCSILDFVARRQTISRSMFIHVVIFAILIPAIGATVALLNYREVGIFPAIFSYAPAYLFLIIALFLTDIPQFFEQTLMIALAIVSLCIVMIFLAGFFINSAIFYVIGMKYSLFDLSFRQYGGIRFIEIYYLTSPMLVLAVGYWGFKALKNSTNKIFPYAMFFLTDIALFLSGTRADILTSFIAPMCLFFVSQKGLKRFLIFIIMLSLVILFFVLWGQTISAMFSVENVSNHQKIGYLADYSREIFSSAHAFLFGHGLGSFFFVSDKNKFDSVTELVYFEIFREYGIVFGAVVMFLIFKPLFHLWAAKDLCCRFMAISYLGYLFMCFVNPYFFSSSGMMVFSYVLLMVYVRRHVKDKPNQTLVSPSNRGM